jgi:hypothetical protein
MRTTSRRRSFIAAKIISFVSPPAPHPHAEAPFSLIGTMVKPYDPTKASLTLTLELFMKKFTELAERQSHPSGNSVDYVNL